MSYYNCKYVYNQSMSMFVIRDFLDEFLTLREEKIPIYIVKKYISSITDKLKLEKLIAEKRE